MKTNPTKKKSYRKKSSKNPLKDLPKIPQNCVKNCLKHSQKSSKNAPQNPQKDKKKLPKKIPIPEIRPRIRDLFSIRYCNENICFLISC